MTNPEFIQSAATVVHQARELLDAGARTNLLQTLIEHGHPYGLLLNAEAASGPSLYCSSASSLLGGESSENSVAGFDPLSSLPFSGLSLVNFSIVNTMMFEQLLKRQRQHDYSGAEPGESWAAEGYNHLNFGGRISRRLQFSYDEYAWAGALIYGLSLTSLSKSFLKSAVNSNQDFDNFWNSQIVLTPGILKSLTELGERPRKLWVGKNQLGLGTSSIHLGNYRGEAPYLIKTPQGEMLTQINPGDQIGSVHVSSQASQLCRLSPLEKVEQITRDFIDLLKAIENGGNVDLTERQQKTIDKARTATFIGISHLVRLFGRKTGLPTWKLDVLPELVQKFHRHDSQAVSRAFGGTRKVKATDVEMMVITPKMRRQLVATV